MAFALLRAVRFRFQTQRISRGPLRGHQRAGIPGIVTGVSGAVWSLSPVTRRTEWASILRTVSRCSPNTPEASRTLMPSTIVAPSVRSATALVDGGAWSNFQPLFVSRSIRLSGTL